MIHPTARTETLHPPPRTVIVAPSPALLPARLFAPTPKAAKRVLEFFTAHLNNDHTRKAYLNATRRFAAWCEDHGLHELAAAQPVHVAAFVRELQGRFTPPKVKQHLAALRMLFDWLMTGHVMEPNPAHAVRGPTYVVKKGKTPVLDAIPIGTLTGLRDRAVIGVMIYTFARVARPISMLPHTAKKEGGSQSLIRSRSKTPFAAVKPESLCGKSRPATTFHTA